MHALLSWDEYLLGFAQHAARKSKDPSTKCGAAIVRPDYSVAATGFNGYPRGVPDIDLDNRPVKYSRMIHAEMNAIHFLRERADGYCIYTWPFGPCCRCAVHIAQAGIKRVVSPLGAPERWEESLKQSRWIFQYAGVDFVEI